MKKGGLSTVVSTLIIVLLVLVAVGIVWLVLSNLIEEDSEVVKAKAAMLQERLEILKVDVQEPLKPSVNLQKLSGSSILAGSEEIEIPIKVDVISVADISASMRVCKNVVNENACCALLGSPWPLNGACYGIGVEDETPCKEDLDCLGTFEDGLTPSQEANIGLVDSLFERQDFDDARMGLVAYYRNVHGDGSSNLVNYNGEADLKDKIENHWIMDIGTCICCGINDAKDKFQQNSEESTQKTMIVMSDGLAIDACPEQGTGDAKQDAIDAACEAGQMQNLIIHSVALGDADTQTMQAIANCGDGNMYDAYGVNDLIEVYDSIKNQIIWHYRSLNMLAYLKIVFYSETDSVIEKIDVPDVLEIKKYDFDLTGKINFPIIKIEVYPVVVSSSGKEIVGNALDSWELEA